MLRKNVSGQGVYLFAYDKTTGDAVTGDAGNMSGFVSKDGGAAASANGTIIEIAGGYYWLPVTQAETNADAVAIFATSTTADVLIRGVDGFTDSQLTANNASILSALPTGFNNLVVSGTGEVAANVVKWNSESVSDFDEMTVGGVSAIVGANILQISGDTDAANNLESDYDGTGYEKANSTIGTTTVNTDMRGTNGANTIAPDNAAIANIAIDTATMRPQVLNLWQTFDDIGFDMMQIRNAVINDLTIAIADQHRAIVDAAIENYGLQYLFHTAYDPDSKPGNAGGLFNVMIESDGGTPRYTVNALSQAPSGGGGGSGNVTAIVGDTGAAERLAALMNATGTTDEAIAANVVTWTINPVTVANGASTNSITITRGTTVDFNLNIGPIVGQQNVILTVKAEPDVIDDSTANIQIDTTGLLRSNGEAATLANGGVTVVDENAGTCRFQWKAEESVKLPIDFDLYFDVSWIDADGDKHTPVKGTFDSQWNATQKVS